MDKRLLDIETIRRLLEIGSIQREYDPPDGTNGVPFRLGVFDTMPKPYRLANSPFLDPEALAKRLRELELFPLELAREAEHTMRTVNVTALPVEMRLKLTRTALHPVYAMASELFSVYARQHDSQQDDHERRATLEVCISALQQIRVAYQRAFQEDYALSDRKYAKVRNRVMQSGLRILELIRLEQRLRALHYQRLDATSWYAANQTFFSLLVRDDVCEALPLIGTAGTICMQNDLAKRHSDTDSVEQVYLSVQLFGLINPTTLPRRAFQLADVYLRDTGPRLILETTDYVDENLPGVYLSRADNHGPPEPVASERPYVPSALIDLRPLIELLEHDHSLLRAFDQPTGRKPTRLSRASKRVDATIRRPVIDQMLKGLRPYARQHERSILGDRGELRVYFGFNACYRYVQDRLWKEPPPQESEDRLTGSPHRQSSTLENDDRVHLAVPWSISNFSAGGALISTEETDSTASVEIGQLVALCPLQSRSSLPQLGYVSRIQRTGVPKTQLDICIVRLSPCLSIYLEAAVVQSPKQRANNIEMPAFLMRGINNAWQLILNHAADYAPGQVLMLVRNNDQRVPLRLGAIKHRHGGFVAFNVHSPALAQLGPSV